MAEEHEARQPYKCAVCGAKFIYSQASSSEELHSERTSGAVPAQGLPMTGHSAASHEGQWASFHVESEEHSRGTDLDESSPHTRYTSYHSWVMPIVQRI